MCISIQYLWKTCFCVCIQICNLLSMTGMDGYEGLVIQTTGRAEVIYLTHHPYFHLYTFPFTIIHIFTICPISLCFCFTPQAYVCDAGVQHKGSAVSAGWTCCPSVWFYIFPENHGSSRRQHLY